MKLQVLVDYLRKNATLKSVKQVNSVVSPLCSKWHNPLEAN